MNNRHFGYKESEFGSDTNGHNVKAYGDTTGKYFEWNPATNSFKISGTLSLNGTDITAKGSEINRTCSASGRISDIGVATLTVTEFSHENRVIIINRAAGVTFTLPAATGSGGKYTFIVKTSITSGAAIIKVVANDVMFGTAIICNDSDNSVSGFETAADSDTITLNGSTTGGLKGDIVELIDIATDTWFVRITGRATDAEATPFSATVT